MKILHRSLPIALALGLGLASSQLPIQDEFRWDVHDLERPLASVVEPGQAAGPPSDAVLLLGEQQGTEAWRSGAADAAWTLLDGILTVKPGSGVLTTRASFGDCQLHLEWRVPEGREIKGQSGANSGVFLMERYEIQILQSHGNESYADGMAGAVYGQYPPLANPCRPVGQWNTYDIVFRAPRFDEAGELTQPAYATVHFNGVLVQDNVRLLGPTRHKVRTSYSKHPDKQPLVLQDHGDPISFRNIWIRELPARRGPE